MSLSLAALKSKLAALRGKSDKVAIVSAELLEHPIATGATCATIYGTTRERDGETHHLLVSTTPSEELAAIATIGQPDESTEGLRLDPSTTPARAWFNGTAIEVVIVDPSAYRDRIRALPGVDALADARALIVGCGSVGSSVGVELARAGVTVTICDPERLEVPNLVRWGIQAGLDQIGRHKVHAWTELVRASVVDAKVEGHVIDVVRDAGRFDSLIRGARPDLIIATSDTNDSRRNINALAALHGVPVLYVALSDHAASARFELVEDAALGPCHLCSTAAETPLTGESTYGGRHSATPYASAEGHPEQVAVPALPANIALANAYATRIALQLLAGGGWAEFFTHGEQRGNVMFLALEPNWWLFESPLDRLVYTPVRRTDCPICGVATEDEPRTHGPSHSRTRAPRPETTQEV